MSSQEISKVGLKVFFNIMDEWNIDIEDQKVLLAVSSEKQFDNMKRETPFELPHPSLVRVSHIIRIYKLLRILFPTVNQANQWVHKPNDFLNGETALSEMLKGDTRHLEKITEYLTEQTKFPFR